MSKAILYTFNLSVWAAVPDLALIELEYTDQQIEKKFINLGEGENYRPAFLKINPKATLPTLTVDGEVYTSTAEVTSYLVQHSKKHVKTGSSLIEEIHKDAYDPNFVMLSARNDGELKAKASGRPTMLLTNRQNALDEHSVHEDAAPFKPFYEDKIASNGHLLSIYQSKAPDSVKESFFEKSKAHWEVLRSFILETLPTFLPENGGFVGGDVPGEDDLHVAAWLARIATASGAKKTQEGLKAMEKEVGQPLPTKVVNYWNAWAERDSWKQVYGEHLH